jgi:hypothetical protein
MIHLGCSDFYRGAWGTETEEQERLGKEMERSEWDEAQSAAEPLHSSMSRQAAQSAGELGGCCCLLANSGRWVW